MLDIQQKRKFKSVIYNKVTIFVLFVLVLLVVHSTWGVYLKKRESIEMMNISQEKLAELESRDSELDLKINKLNTQSGIEEEIRSKFSVTKADESMVIIVRENGEASSTPNEDLGFWDKLRSFFR